MAHQLNHDESTYSRADLAYELQKKDSLEISRLAWEAYCYFKNDKIIKKCFLDNEGKQLIVSEYELYQLINGNNNDTLFPLLNKKLSRVETSIKNVDNATISTIKGEIIVAGSNLMSKISGSSGAIKVQEEATGALEGYTNLVDSYLQLKSDIKSTITDFVFLRGEIEKVYRQYVMTLIDTFGDSIKSVAPNLFDFGSIEWLDVANMLKEIELEYNSIFDNCSVLIADVNQNFGNALQSAANSYKSSGSKAGGLIMAAINMTTHYMDASQKTTELKNQLLTLKNKMKRDATHIKGDTGRMLVIYKQLNDLFIPKAQAFYKFNGQILSNEYEQLINALYQNPELKSLKEERDQVLADYKVYQQNITDSQMNINYYSNHISECNNALSQRKQQYVDAKNSKPLKPFFLFNWISFGALKRSYNRSIFEWNQVCSPVIREYESFQVDVKMDMDELKQQQEFLKENEQQSQQSKIELDKLTKQISSKLKVDDKVKSQMADHLESIIKLLWVAKDIMNSKLDEKLIHTVKIKDSAIQLPQEVENNILTFTNGLKNIVEVDENMAKKSVTKVHEFTSGEKQKLKQNESKENVSDEEIANIVTAENEAVQKGIDLLGQWALLKTRQANSELAGIAYDNQLRQLQNTFRKSMSDIDQQSAVLSEILKQINTADNNDTLKEGLLQLGDFKDKSLTKDDLDEFLNGNKTIEL